MKSDVAGAKSELEQIHNIDEAFERYKSLMYSYGWKVVAFYYRNFRRHLLLKFVDLYGGKKSMLHYLVYQTKWFEEYEKFFPNEVGQGLGASINLDILKTIVAEQVDYLVYATPIGKFFKMRAKDVLEYVFSHNTIRTQQRTKEITASFPVTMMDLVN